jgi:hypothetical protein
MTPKRPQGEFVMKFRNRKVNDWRAQRAKTALADSHQANPIPVCSEINNYGGDQLWTSGV